MASVETYLAVRRAVGFTLSNTEYLLRSFAEFATDLKETHIRTATAIDRASQAKSVAQRHTRHQTICRFAQYLRMEDSRHELPPRTTSATGRLVVSRTFIHARDRWACPRRHEASIVRLVAAQDVCSADQPLGGDRATDFGGVTSAGLRHHPQRVANPQNEVSKTRSVPLHDTAVTGLARYLMHRQEARRGGDHVFVSDEGQPLVYWKVHSVFRTLLKSAGIKPSGGRWPRVSG